MRRGHAGFTLIELQIVVAVIAVLAAIAAPGILAGRLAANETVAIATLRSIVSAQAQFREGGRVDADGVGIGEYGGFLELSGAQAGRMATTLVPPVVSGAFRVLDANGAVARSGYLFRLVLPGADGAGVPEPAGGFVAGSGVDADLAETTWCVYAWPATHGKSGRRAFFANQRGDLLSTELPAYSGGASGPAPDAAFAVAGAITGATALGAPGADAPFGWREAANA